MRAHDDFGTMKGERNPYVKALKQPVTMRLDKATVTYFDALVSEVEQQPPPVLPTRADAGSQTERLAVRMRR